MHPRYPGRFAVAVLLAAVAAGGGYAVSRTLRQPVVPAAPPAPEGGLQLVQVGALSAPPAQPAVSPRWSPELAAPEAPPPDAPSISAVALPAAGAFREFGLLSVPAEAPGLPPGAAAELPLASAETVAPQKWSLSAPPAQPPPPIVPRPAPLKRDMSAELPSPAIAPHTDPRPPAEWCRHGEPLPPAHPKADEPLGEPAR